MQKQTDPLPVGRYSLDVADFPEGHIDEWHGFVHANASKLKVTENEEHDAEGGVPKRLFTIFEVTEPVFFPAQNFGFPTIAPANVKSESDTIQAPDDDETTDPGARLRLALLVGGAVVVAGVAIYFAVSSAARARVASQSPAPG